MADLLKFTIYGDCITVRLDDLMLCDEEETYIGDVQFTGTQTAKFPNGYNPSGGLYCRYAPDAYHDGRACIYIDENSTASGRAPSILGMGCYFANDVFGYLQDNSSYLCKVDGNMVTSLVEDNVAIFSTNIPFFDNPTDADTYYRTGTGIDKAKNITATPDEENDEVYLYSMGVVQTWDVTGLIFENDSASVVYHKGIRGKLKKGRVSLYPITGISDSALKYGIKVSNDVEWVYLEEINGHTYLWERVEQLSVDFMYRKRNDEIGTFHASRVALDTSKEFNAKIPIFEDEETADGYIDGTVDITDALNWKTISTQYPIANGTGDSDDETLFGEVYAKNFFSQCYLCGSTAIQEIANALFDTDATGVTHLWEKIKEGLDMFGSDPMQAVQGLTYFPVNLTDIFSNYSSQQYIYFGGYKLDLSVSVNRLVFPNGYKTLGSFTLKKTFKNWRDYEPYSKVYIYLPYVGKYQLDLARYYDKSVEIRYYIDIRTGSCVACLIADGILLDYYNGQIGVQMPITLTDKSAYANAQVETLLGGLKHEGSVLQGAGNTYSAGGSAGAYVAAAQATAGTMLNASMTTYKLADNNLNNYNKTKGGSTSMLNEYLPQYAYLIFEVQQDDPTANHDSLLGTPSNESGTVGVFSGFLQVEKVNLSCGIATPNEKNEILSALYNGIII